MQIANYQTRLTGPKGLKGKDMKPYLATFNWAGKKVTGYQLAVLKKKNKQSAKLKKQLGIEE